MNTLAKFAAAACLAIGLPAAALATDEDLDPGMEVEAEIDLPAAEAATLIDEFAVTAADIEALAEGDTVTVINLADLRAGAAPEQAGAIDAALEAMETDIESLLDALTNNAVVAAKLKAAGYAPAQIVAVATHDEHGFIVFVEGDPEDASNMVPAGDDAASDGAGAAPEKEAVDAPPGDDGEPNRDAAEDDMDGEQGEEEADDGN